MVLLQGVGVSPIKVSFLDWNRYWAAKFLNIPHNARRNRHGPTWFVHPDETVYCVWAMTCETTSANLTHIFPKSSSSVDNIISPCRSAWSGVALVGRQLLEEEVQMSAAVQPFNEVFVLLLRRRWRRRATWEALDAQCRDVAARVNTRLCVPRASVNLHTTRYKQLRQPSSVYSVIFLQTLSTQPRGTTDYVTSQTWTYIDLFLYHCCTGRIFSDLTW